MMGVALAEVAGQEFVEMALVGSAEATGSFECAGKDIWGGLGVGH